MSWELYLPPIIKIPRNKRNREEDLEFVRSHAKMTARTMRESLGCDARYLTALRQEAGVARTRRKLTTEDKAYIIKMAAVLTYAEIARRLCAHQDTVRSYAVRSGIASLEAVRQRVLATKVMVIKENEKHRRIYRGGRNTQGGRP